jgi:hypothetical protein
MSSGLARPFLNFSGKRICFFQCGSLLIADRDQQESALPLPEPIRGYFVCRASPVAHLLSRISWVALQQSPCPLRRSFTASLSTLLLYSLRQRNVTCPHFPCLNSGVHFIRMSRISRISVPHLSRVQSAWKPQLRHNNYYDRNSVRYRREGPQGCRSNRLEETSSTVGRHRGCLGFAVAPPRKTHTV